MLIVNDEQRLQAGIGSLSKRCSYCSKALAAYPLILSDEAKLMVYHAACAAALATDILVDLYTFLSPPAPIRGCLCSLHPMPLPPTRSLWSGSDRGASREPRVWKGGVDAINQRSPDQGGPGGASFSRQHLGELSHRADRGRKIGERGSSW